ncbi:helix-turn-helix domain-containing protein [bacterium]|nr:helix-turn-helix domain-containing protein [bacterium]
MKSSRLNRTLAKNIRLLRADLELSQEGLAERCSVHRTYIGAIERGERNITLNTLQRIADALGVEPLCLLKAGGK